MNYVLLAAVDKGDGAKEIGFALLLLLVLLLLFGGNKKGK